jgi:uncharacterized protein
MKIVIPGGTGQVGSVLAREFHKAGHDVVVLSRTPRDLPWKVVTWDARTLGKWTEELEGADVVINLVGRSVNCRYHQKNRDLIMNSRIESTKVVGEAIAKAKNPPRVWLQASTATIYSHRYDTPNDDVTGIIGGLEPDAPDAWRFSIDVATSWEKIFNEANTPKTRKVLLRSAMTMSPDPGGIFATLLRLVRLGFGGKSGNGKQYISWIHEEDFIRSILWLIDHEELSGPVNLCSPHPLPNDEFMRQLRAAWGARFGLPATEWMLGIGAVFIRTETELILKSRRVVPTRLVQSGFAFKFPNWKEAAQDLCECWREKSKTERSLDCARDDNQYPSVTT